jgi:hypothetical protein
MRRLCSGESHTSCNTSEIPQRIRPSSSPEPHAYCSPSGAYSCACSIYSGHVGASFGRADRLLSLLQRGRFSSLGAVNMMAGGAAWAFGLGFSGGVGRAVALSKDQFGEPSQGSCDRVYLALVESGATGTVLKALGGFCGARSAYALLVSADSPRAVTLPLRDSRLLGLTLISRLNWNPHGGAARNKRRREAKPGSRTQQNLHTRLHQLHHLSLKRLSVTATATTCYYNITHTLFQVDLIIQRVISTDSPPRG